MPVTGSFAPEAVVRFDPNEANSALHQPGAASTMLTAELVGITRVSRNPARDACPSVKRSRGMPIKFAMGAIITTRCSCPAV
jgi:hypothetical protein